MVLNPIAVFMVESLAPRLGEIFSIAVRISYFLLQSTTLLYAVNIVCSSIVVVLQFIIKKEEEI